jgi:linoleate 9S-lipoxygenase
MQSIIELATACTTIIWITLGLHAAVNSGQYPYTTCRSRAQGVEKDLERTFIRTITSQLQTIIGISLREILSKHSSDRLVEIEEKVVSENRNQAPPVAALPYG